MKSKNRVFNLLILCILAFSSLGAKEYQFGSGWGTPKNPRSVGLSKPVAESELSISSAAMSPETVVALLPKMSGNSAELLARKMGLTQLEGRKIEDLKRTELDNPVSVYSGYFENEPSMAVNPTNEAIAVVFSHYYGPTDGSCQAMVSYDGGDTFDYNNYVFPPMMNAGDTCSDPVVRFSPDGAYVYYFYMNVLASTAGATSNIVMQRAYGSDPTTLYGSPIVVFTGDTAFMDKEWGDVSTWDMATTGGANANVVYATSTKFYSNSDCAIVYNVSFDYGTTWYYPTSSPLIIDYSTGCSRVIQGARPIGGNVSTTTGGDFVLICWYDSGGDGYLFGGFYIDCIAHDFYGIPGGGGAAWSPYFAPGGKRNYELGAWLGPNSSYHRWRGGMFPSLAVDEQGMAYLAYTQDPTASQIDVESGNVSVSQHLLNYFVISAWPTVAVGTGATAQGYATVAARYDATLGKYAVYVAYGDYTANNVGYNTVYRKGIRLPSGTAMSYLAKIKISDRTSFSDYQFIGDYIDSAITARRYHVTWTDRSDVYSKYDYDDDIMHDVSVP